MNYNTVLNMLQNGVKDDNWNIKANKDLRIERWLMSNFLTLENLDEEKWQFVANVFSDPSCWNGIKLERETVGLRFIEESKEEGKKNPLNIYDRYYFACKYCLIDQVPSLFREVFTQFKEEMEFDPKHDDNYIREELLRDLKGSSAMEYFWSSCLDKVSGELIDYASIEKFKEVMHIHNEIKWGEGIEFFYNGLQHDQRIQNYLIDIVLSVSKEHIYTDIVEFCILKMNNEQKKELLQRDYKENNCHILFSLVDQYHLQSLCDLLEHLNVSSFNSKEYYKLFSSLTEKILLNSDLTTQTKETIMHFWKHEKLEEFRKDIFKYYGIQYAIAAFIVDLRDNSNNETKKSEVLAILQHADIGEINALREPLLRTMVQKHGIGEEQYKKDVALIEDLLKLINLMLNKESKEPDMSLVKLLHTGANLLVLANKEEQMPNTNKTNCIMCNSQI